MKAFEKKDNWLCQTLHLDFPIIMAPMFLVSNANMLIAACESGITGAVPALNYRTDEDFRKALDEIKASTNKPIGVNLIVNKSNMLLHKQLKTCCDYRIGFVITSLGSPESVIKACKPLGIKVFCDVVDVETAMKVEALGADAIIAVNNQAGGHAGSLSPQALIASIRDNCSLPVISAGGAGNSEEIMQMLELGAVGVSMGSVFIASEEAPVSLEYKKACVDYGKKDIVRTTKLSGTPCTVINTPYVQKTGTQQNWLEQLLNRNKKLKKWVKMLTFYRGMKALEKAAFSNTYQSVWCAGPSIEHVHSIQSVKKIVSDLTTNFR